MRLHLRAAFAGLALAVSAAAAAADDTAPASREEAVVRWALTHAPVDDAIRGRVAELAAAPSQECDEELFRIGEPARRTLLALAGTDAALAARTEKLRARMQDLEDEVERRCLHHDLIYLAALGPRGEARLRRIVPEETPQEDALAWCMDRAGLLRWEPTLDRFVLAPKWDRDQAPRRWRNRDTVTMRKTEAFLGAGSPFTAEAWVRWPSGSPQYLLGDECWKGMSPAVRVDRERGFVIRRNPRGDVTGTLDFTFAIGPKGWFAVESAPLRTSTLWEHVAVSSDGRVVRIFRDGQMVAARDVAGVECVRGVGDLAIGVRPNGREDRRAEFDLRGFRISEGARYTKDFVPPHRFEKDASTVVLLDFTPDQAVLRDLSGSGHDASGEGHWIPPHDLGALRGDLAVFGGLPSETVLAEAESGGWTNQWWKSERSQYSEGINLEIWSDLDPGVEGHAVSIPFRVPRSGRYRVHFVGGGLHRGDEGFSPFSWRVDEKPWTPVNAPMPALYGLLGRSDLDLSPLGTVDLEGGEHMFRLRLLARRRHADRRWSLWIDAIVLTAVPEDATGPRR